MGKFFWDWLILTFNISWLKCSLIVFTLRKGLFMFSKTWTCAFQSRVLNYDNDEELEPVVGIESWLEWDWFSRGFGSELWMEFIKHFGPTLGSHHNQNVAWVAYVKDFMFINNINGCQPQAIGVILAWEWMKNYEHNDIYIFGN